MKVLFDTNVVLDLLLDRKPFSDDAAFLFSLLERGKIQGFLCATTITTISYLLEKAIDRDSAHRHIDNLLELFEIAAVTRIVLETAMRLGFRDFEDAVLHAAAEHAGADYLITRNVTDFRRASLSILAPHEFIAMYRLRNH